MSATISFILKTFSFYCSLLVLAVRALLLHCIGVALYATSTTTCMARSACTKIETNLKKRAYVIASQIRCDMLV